MEHKRRYERYPAKVPAEIVLARGAIQAETSDVSFTGMFLRCEQPPPMRELIKIRVMPGGSPQQVMGMAVHLVKPTDAEPRYGVGVQLFGLDPDSRRTWEALVQKLRQVHTQNEQAGGRDVRGAAAARPEPGPQVKITPTKITTQSPMPRPTFQVTASVHTAGGAPGVRVGPVDVGPPPDSQQPSLDIDIDGPTGDVDRTEDTGPTGDTGATIDMPTALLIPADDLPAADWAPEESYFYETLIPELRLKLHSEEELERIRDTAAQGELLHLRTEVFLKVGTRIRVRLLEPSQGLAFVSEALVERAEAEGALTELALKLTPRTRAPTEDVYVTVDLQVQ